MEALQEKLLEIREYIKLIVGRYESYIKPLGKFLLSFITLKIINGNVGFATRLTSTAIVLIVSLLASFLPMNFIPVIAAFFILLHMYSLSLESLAVVGILLVLMFLLYFRFAPKDTILAVGTPVLYVLKIPYAMPLVAGLVAPPTAMVSTGCGVVLRYILKFFKDNQEAIKANSEGEIIDRFRFVLDGVLFNKEMYVAVVAFAVTIGVVCVIRRLDVDHAWTLAIIAGALTDIVVILLGDLKLGTYISVSSLILSSIVGLIISYIIQLFLFNLDYSRTEKVQFEDDEYYYFVKAVPKNLFDLKSGKKVVGSDMQSIKKAPAQRRTAQDSISEIDDEDDAVSYQVKRRSRDMQDAESRRGQKDGLSELERAAAEKARRTRTQQKNEKK